MALLVGRALEALLFEVTPVDPLALGLAALAFATVAFATCAIPAVRAARVNLVAALHHD